MSGAYRLAEPPAIRLGDLARDKITGFEGVVIARTEWLHNCVRLTLQPRKLHDGKPVEAQSFDLPILELVEASAVSAGDAKTGGPRPEPRR